MSIFTFPRILWCGIIVLIISLGIRQSFGIFMMPISDHFETGRSFFSFAIALQNLSFGFFQPFVGMAADKWGSKRVILLGACVYALGLFLTAITTEPELIYLTLGVFVGLGLSATSYVVILGAIAKVIPAQHAAKAFGLTTAAGSFGMFAMIPGAQSLLTGLGWQDALSVFALLCSVIFASACMMETKNPSKKVISSDLEQNQLSLKMALREAFSHKGYWLINAGFFVCGFQVMFIATHLPSYLADKNLPLHVAALALAYVGIFNIFGSYFWGVMGDKFNKRYVMSSLYFMRTFVIGGFFFFPITETSAAIFGGLIGFCWLGTVPLTSGLVRQIFGAKYMSTLYGIVFFTHQVGSFLGAWLGGKLYDMHGSYDQIWLATITLAFVAALLHLPINDAPLKRDNLQTA